jgi:hypothetical protein
MPWPSSRNACHNTTTTTNNNVLVVDGWLMVGCLFAKI